MIKTLTIDNFQSHATSRFDFHPGVNVIVGTSRSGKSAALRALRLVVENKAPKGEWRRWGSKLTTVAIETDTDFVERRRTASRNEYLLNDLLLTAFGMDTPDKVRAALNFDEINFQWQHDRPFLLDETAGEVARALNRVARLDQIDTALSNIDSTRRAQRLALQSCVEEVKYADTDLSAYDYLPQLEAEIARLEAIDKRRAVVVEATNALGSLLRSIESETNTVKEYAWVEEAAELCASVDAASVCLSDLQARISAIRQLGASIREQMRIVEECEVYEELEPRVLRLFQLQSAYTSHAEKTEQLAAAVRAVRHAESEAHSATCTLSLLETRWSETATGTCPLCGGTGRL